MDAIEFLKSGSTELVMRAAINKSADELLLTLQRRQADLIAASVAKLFKK